MDAGFEVCVILAIHFKGRLLPDPVPDLSRCRFVQTLPRADAMAALAQEAFDKGKFEDVAYFEPFYLKDFVATTPKKKLF